MPRRLAIVPARGGSKRIPNKNVREFCGRPMISYVLDAAQTSSLFNVIHVSTDSSEIAKVVADLGFPPDFPRPANLADDHTPLMPVLRYAAETYAGRGQTFDQIWLLMACAPLIRSQDLRDAAALFEAAGNSSAVLSVTRYPAPIEWAFGRRTDGRLVPVEPGKFALRSQDLEPRYFDTGSYVIYPAAQVLSSVGAGDDTRFIGHVQPRLRSIDIDDLEDWHNAELLYRTFQANS